MIYTLFISKKLDEDNQTQFWEIIDKVRFSKPQAMTKYLLEHKLLSDKTIKLELYEGRYEELELNQRPNVIRVFKEHSFVELPNGNMQLLAVFLNHWKQFNVACAA